MVYVLIEVTRVLTVCRRLLPTKCGEICTLNVCWWKNLENTFWVLMSKVLHIFSKLVAYNSLCKMSITTKCHISSFVEHFVEHFVGDERWTCANGQWKLINQF